MAIFGKKREEESRKSPDFIKIAFDASHRPVDLSPTTGPDFVTSRLSDQDREWLEKKFEYMNGMINSLRTEISYMPQKTTTQGDLAQFLSKWKQDFANNLDEVMFRIKALAQDSEINRELRHVDEGLKLLKKEIHADVIPKDEIMGRLADIQSKVTSTNQQIYQKLVGKYELSEEIAKALVNILPTVKTQKKAESKVKIGRAVIDRIITNYLAIKDSEKVVVLTDKKMMKLGKIFYDAARGVNGKTVMVVMEKRTRDGEEPDENIARLVKESDAVIIVTYYSLLHTNFVKEALQTGARIISLARISVASFIDGGMTADPQQVKTITEKMFDHVKNAKEIHVTSPNGTDVKFLVEDRQWLKNDGFARNMGDVAALPAGSVMIAPVESTVNGKIVFDRIEPKNKIELTVENGIIRKMKGSIKKAKDVFGKFGLKALTVGIFGIGCNPTAKFIGNITEDKKVFGNIYFGIGNNVVLGGNVNIPFHTTGVVKNATVYVNEFAVIKDGKFVE